MKLSNKLTAMVAIMLLLPMLAACGGTTATDTPVPVPTATTVSAAAPTTAMATTPTMAITTGSAVTPTAMMAMTPTAMMTATAGMVMTPTAGMAMTGTQMMGMTPTAGAMMTGTQMMGTTPTAGAMMTGTASMAMTGTTPTAAPKAPTPTATPADVGQAAPNATKITFWHTQTRRNADTLNAMVADFNKTHPDVFVTPQYKGGYTDLLTAVQTAAAGGQLPDLTVGYENWLPGLISADAVVPFDDYINDPTNGLSASDMSDILPQFIATNKYPAYSNKMYSFPFTKSTLTMWVNNDLLKKIGKSAPPTTWAEFVADSQAIRALGSDYYGFEFQAEPSMLVGMIYSFGGQMMNADNSQFVFNSPQGVAAMQTLADGVKNGYFLMVAPSTFQEEQDFAKQKVGFILESSTSYSFIPTYYPVDSNKTPVPGSDFDWSAAILPHADGVTAQTTIYGGNIIMYKTGAAQQKAAWEFVKWFTDAPQTAKWASISGYMPLRKSAATTEPLQTLYAKNARAKSAFTNVLPYATDAEPKVGSYQQVRDILASTMTQVVKGTMSATDGMTSAQDKSNQTLK